jgi:hypothetical protein
MTPQLVNSPKDVNSDILPRVNTLSPYQKAILSWLLDCYRHDEAVNSGKVHRVNRDGVHLTRRPAGTSRSVSASASRAIRRLEERGLIRRRNRVSGDKYGRDGRGDHGHGAQVRTVTVELTPAGRVLAEELVEEDADDGPA